MEIQEILSFITVAEQKSFTKAAEKLGYSKASITVHIKNLESELNSELFERLGKHVTLTSKGEMFLADALNVVEALENAKNHLSNSNELTGSLRIGTIDSLSTTKLPSIIEKYHKKHSKVKVNIITDTIQGLLNKIMSNDIDLAYLFDVKINDYTFNNIEVCKNNASFVVSKENNLAKLDKVTLLDLQKETLILTEKDASYRRALDEDLGKLGQKIEASFEAQSTEVILKLLERNLGVSYLPEYVVTNNSYLVKLNTDYDQIMDEQILYHKDKKLTREISEMIEVIKENNIN